MSSSFNFLQLTQTILHEMMESNFQRVTIKWLWELISCLRTQSNDAEDLTPVLQEIFGIQKNLLAQLVYAESTFKVQRHLSRRRLQARTQEPEQCFRNERRRPPKMCHMQHPSLQPPVVIVGQAPQASRLQRRQSRRQSWRQQRLQQCGRQQVLELRQKQREEEEQLEQEHQQQHQQRMHVMEELLVLGCQLLCAAPNKDPVLGSVVEGMLQAFDAGVPIQRAARFLSTDCLNFVSRALLAQGSDICRDLPEKLQNMTRTRTLLGHCLPAVLQAAKGDANWIHQLSGIPKCLTDQISIPFQALHDEL